MTPASFSTAITALAPDDLPTWITEHLDLVEVDVLSAAEFESMHIGGSYNVPLPLLSEHTDELAAAGGDVVKGKDRWDLERQVRLAAGSLVVLGLAGGRFASPKIRMPAGVIGTGRTFSAATNTYAMGKALPAMPWNRAAKEPTRESAIMRLPAAETKQPRQHDRGPVTGACCRGRSRNRRWRRLHHRRPRPTLWASPLRGAGQLLAGWWIRPS